MSEVAEFDITKPYCNLPVAEAMEFYDWLEHLTSPPAKRGKGMMTRRRFLGTTAAVTTGIIMDQAAQRVGPLLLPTPAQAAPRSSLVGFPLGEEMEQVLPTPEALHILKHAEAEMGFIEGAVMEAKKVEPTKRDILREMFLPRIIQEVRNIRSERVKGDPDYLKRIDRDLNEGRVNGVALGIGKEGTMTDSILIFSYHIPTNTVFLLSLPRDLQSPEVLRVGKNPAWSRINFAHQLGGIDLVKEVLENATGLSMDLATVSRFDVLEDVINKTVGYVEVDNKEAINDPSYPTKEGAGFEPFKLDKGKQRLSGEKALKYSRSRLHGGSDYVRAGRQQEVFAAFAKRLSEEVQKSPFNKGHLAMAIRNVVLEKINQGRLRPDFDLVGLLSPALEEIVKMTGEGILQQFAGGWELGTPEMKGLVINNRNFVVGAGIEGAAITMIKGGRPDTANPRQDYWRVIRQEVRKQLLQMTEGKEEEEAPKVAESKIYYPQELSYEEVSRWIGMLRGSHEAVLTESLFLKELAQFPREKRERLLARLAGAHAKAMVEHFGENHAVVGLDPGHGGSDIGAGAMTMEGEKLAEKDMTWELVNLTAKELLRLSGGKYDVIILRPETPQDEDIDGDGIVSNIERLQKRKALLLAMAEGLRGPSEGDDRKVAYVSLHFNGLSSANAAGAETYFPNEYAMSDQKKRAGSEALARLLQREIVKAIREEGYEVVDRGVRADPDKREPAHNADNTIGPYIALSSPKLDRNLARREGR